MDLLHVFFTFLAILEVPFYILFDFVPCSIFPYS